MNRRAIFYWAATGLFAFAMAASGVMHVLGDPSVEAGMQSLGYPAYISLFLGIAKLLGVAALVAPVPARLKEWAYAGFAFLIIGAIFSHVSRGQLNMAAIIVLLLFLASYLQYLARPAPRIA